MIETVSTSPVQSLALRSSPQSASRSAEPVASANPGNFVNSRIRVDNLQDVAILEYRSSEGEVLRQYPTPAQIQAFKRAQQLLTESTQASAPASSQEQSAATTAPSGQAAQPAAEAAAAPVAETSAASYAPPSAGGNSTQSVLV